MLMSIRHEVKSESLTHHEQLFPVHMLDHTNLRENGILIDS